MRLAEDLSCAELVELVTDYLEGALAERDRERFEEHIVFCAGCENYLEQMRATIRLAGRIEPESLSPELCDELAAAFRGFAST